jgi:hypothetical protein
LATALLSRRCHPRLRLRLSPTSIGLLPPLGFGRFLPCIRLLRLSPIVILLSLFDEVLQVVWNL